MSAGAIHPAKLPVKFCRPAHFPEVAGPASVCGTDQRFDVPTPSPMQTRIRMATAMWRLTTIQTRRMLEALRRPAQVNVLRTRGGGAPATFRLSESQPDADAEM